MVCDMKLSFRPSCCWIFKLILIIISVLLLNIQTSNAQNIPLKRFLTCWYVKAHIHDAESVFDYKQVQRFSKQEICFKNDTAKMFTDIIVNPHYSMEKVNTEKYLWDNYYYDKKYIGTNADSLYKITITGKGISKRLKNSYPVQYDLFYDGYYLFIFQDGVIFRLHSIWDKKVH